MDNGVSVIVCCYNSAQRLPETLRHLALQRLPAGFPWEVIVVDNASTDATAAVASAEWSRHGSVADFKVVSQSLPGLVNARRMGIEAARYGYVLFCDDDNWLAEDYVQRAFSLMESNGEIGVLGGQCLPAADGSLPAWFYTYCGGYAVGTQSLTSGDVSARGYVWGAGVVMRTSLLKKVYASGVRPLLTGRSGNDNGSGDDSEICKWYLMAGYRLWYDEKLCLHHYMPEHRIDKSYFERIESGFVESRKILEVYDMYMMWKNAAMDSSNNRCSIAKISNAKKLKSIYVKADADVRQTIENIASMVTPQR